MTRASRSALFLLLAGFSLWALAFIMFYALQALGCAYGWPQHRLILVGAYLLALLAMAWLAWTTPHWAPGNGTLAIAAKWANRAALAATILVLLPVSFVSACI